MLLSRGMVSCSLVAWSSAFMYVFRSSDLLSRKDDHTYLASMPVSTTCEPAQPLPFRQTVVNRSTES